MDSNIPVFGYLSTNITFTKDGKPVTIPRGTKVLVDVEECVCLWNDEHIVIYRDEWFPLISDFATYH